MRILVMRSILTVCLLLTFLPAFVQPLAAEDTPTRNSTIPAAAPFRYVSIFSLYIPFKEQPLLSWRETNDLAGAIGGWRFYAREGQKPATPFPPSGIIFDPDTPRPIIPAPDSGTQQHDHGDKQ